MHMGLSVYTELSDIIQIKFHLHQNLQKKANNCSVMLKNDGDSDH